MACGQSKCYLAYVWYHSEYVRITVTHRDFTKATLCSLCKITVSHHDSGISIVIPNTPHFFPSLPHLSHSFSHFEHLRHPSRCALVKKYVQLITYTVYLYDISVDIIKGLNFIKFVCLPFLCIFYAFSFLFLSSINILFSNKT
jgi:hypothetical protein